MDATTLLFLTIIFLIVILGICTMYKHGTRNFSYFANLNVPYIKPMPFVGNMGPMVFKKRSFPDHVKWMYDQMKGHAYFGVYEFMNPTFMVRDPELLKAITVKDFEYFTDHKKVVQADHFFSKMLFNLTGQKWKDMRSTVSPVFTTSKMKMMFDLMNECGDQLIDFLKKCCHNDISPEEPCKIKKGENMLIVEMKDLFIRFGNDLIATVAFGLNVDSLTKPTNEFYEMGKELTDHSGKHALIWIGYLMFPKLMKALNIGFISNNSAEFFRSLVLNTMAAREHQNIVRPDLIHLLMQAKKGALKDEDTPQAEKNPKIRIDDDDVAAQAITFFMAGFHSAATLLSFATLQLAMHPEIQNRVQEEINSIMEEESGKITYAGLQKMKYLEKVFSETLRLFPGGPAIDRQCVKPYTIPADPPIQLKQGDSIWIPVYAYHRDPENFPDPERFDPERFSDENKHNIKPFTYIPFGAGPRACIGTRFAIMQAKMAIVHLLSHFNLKVVSTTPIPIEISKDGYNMTVEGGFWLGLEERQNLK